MAALARQREMGLVLSQQLGHSESKPNYEDKVSRDLSQWETTALPDRDLVKKPKLVTSHGQVLGSQKTTSKTRTQAEPWLRARNDEQAPKGFLLPWAAVCW